MSVALCIRSQTKLSVVRISFNCARRKKRPRQIWRSLYINSRKGFYLKGEPKFASFLI